MNQIIIRRPLGVLSTTKRLIPELETSGNFRPVRKGSSLNLGKGRPSVGTEHLERWLFRHEAQGKNFKKNHCMSSWGYVLEKKNLAKLVLKRPIYEVFLGAPDPPSGKELRGNGRQNRLSCRQLLFQTARPTSFIPYSGR